MNRKSTIKSAFTLSIVGTLAACLSGAPALSADSTPGSSSDASQSDGTTPKTDSTGSTSATTAAPDSTSSTSTTTTAPDSSSGKGTTTAPSSDSAASSGREPLKGGAALSQAEEIKQLRIAAQKLQKTAGDLNGEATTQKMQMMYEPDVIGPMGEVVMIPRPQPTGEYLPPRKKWVDQYLSELTTLIPLVREEFTDVIKSYPEEALDKEKPELADLSALLDDVDKQLVLLKQLQQANNYDNVALAGPSSAMHDDMGKAKATGKKLFRALKKFSNKKSHV